MRDAQLDKMTAKELTALKSRIDEMIVERAEREKAELIAELGELAQKRGHSIDTLFRGGKRGRGGRPKTTGVVKYRNSSDPSQTWSGRGRKPKWIAQVGGDVERFRVR